MRFARKVEHHVFSLHWLSARAFVMAAAAGLAVFSFDESDLDDAVESYNLVKARNVRPDSERPFYVKVRAFAIDIAIESIRTGQGIVRKRYPVFKTAKGNQMKVLISDGENSKTRGAPFLFSLTVDFRKIISS